MLASAIWAIDRVLIRYLLSTVWAVQGEVHLFCHFREYRLIIVPPAMTHRANNVLSVDAKVIVLVVVVFR